jgi:tRNA G37 N-methylase TrmD
MAGVLIQARSLAAYAEAEIEVGHYRGRAGQLVGLVLAQSVTRLSVV